MSGLEFLRSVAIGVVCLLAFLLAIPPLMWLLKIWGAYWQ